MKADLHVHSLHSDDGRQDVKDILRRCSELGIGAVSITDHNSIDGSLDALNNDQGIIVLVGEEVTTSGGNHVLAYGIRECIPKGRSVKETIEMIHAQGGAAVAAHPYRTMSGLGREETELSDFDGIETLNGRSLASANRRSKAIAVRMGVGVIGGSDSHGLESIGRCGTIFPEWVSSAQDMVAAIRNGETSTYGESRSLAKSLLSAIMGIVRWARRGGKRI